MKLLLNFSEAAEQLTVSRASVEALVKSGQIPTVRIGRSIRIHVDALASFAKTGTQNKTTEGRELHPLWTGKETQ